MKKTYCKPHRLRSILTLLLLCCSFVTATAQELTVAKMEALSFDTYASVNRRLDNNEKPCAVVKVSLPLDEVTFKGTNHIGSIDRQGAEYIIFMPTGSKKMYIQHPNFHELEVTFKDYGIDRLQEVVTYRLTINVPSNGNSNIIDDTHQQNVRFKVTPAVKAKIKINGFTFDTEADGTRNIPLPIGKMQYVVSADGYYDGEGTVETTAEGNTLLIDVPLKHYQGKLDVKVSQSGATIKLDGVELGKSPLNQIAVNTGTHTLEVTCPNYRTETRQITIKEGELSQVQFTLINTTLFTINASPHGSTLYINGEHKGYTPYKVELPSGDYNIRLSHLKYKTLSKKVHLDSSKPQHTFTLARLLQLRNQFYMQPMMQVGAYQAAGLGIGGFLSNINVEADAFYGLGTEKIYWNNVGSSSYVLRPLEDKLSTYYVGGKVGYGIIVGTRLRITPQLGGGYVAISGNVSESYVVNASLGVRTDFALVRCLGIVLAPEYSFPIAKAEAYQKISAVSDKVKNWGGGFNLRLGLSVFF